MLKPDSPFPLFPFVSEAFLRGRYCSSTSAHANRRAICATVVLKIWKANCGATPNANMRRVTGTTIQRSFQRRSGKLLQIGGSGPLKSDCIARRKTIAVTSRPTVAMAVGHGAKGNDPLKIRNSPMKPFRPGSPNHANMATLLHPQSWGVRCMSPPKSSRPRNARRCSSNPTK